MVDQPHIMQSWTWKTFKHHFLHQMCGDPKEEMRKAQKELHALSQKGMRSFNDYNDYILKFTELVPLVPKMTQQDRIYLFTEGTQGQVYNDLVDKQPTSLNDAIQIARQALIKIEHYRNKPFKPKPPRRPPYHRPMKKFNAFNWN